MPRKKSEPTPAPDGEAPKKVAVQPRKPGEWMQLVDAAKHDHFRRIIVTIQVRGWLLAGKPAALDHAKAMLKARGLEDQIEAVPIDDPNARTEAAETVKMEGLCEFHRREGMPGIWFPTNHIKAGLKENWSVLGFRNEFRGTRGALAEAVFVYSVVSPESPSIERDWILLGEKPDGVYEAVSHTVGPSGPVSSLKRHEYVNKPQLTFVVAIEAHTNAPKIPDEALARTFYHFGEHGLGACRSQGFGRFDIIDIREETGVAPQVVAQ